MKLLIYVIIYVMLVLIFRLLEGIGNSEPYEIDSRSALRIIMLEKKLNQKELADDMGISSTAVSYIFNDYDVGDVTMSRVEYYIRYNIDIVYDKLKISHKKPILVSSCKKQN